MLVRAAYQQCVCMQEMRLQSATLGTCQVTKTCGKGHWEWLGILRAPAHAVQLKRHCIQNFRACLATLGLRQASMVVKHLTDSYCIHIHIPVFIQLLRKLCILCIILIPFCQVWYVRAYSWCCTYAQACKPFLQSRLLHSGTCNWNEAL